ncbi:MAG: hypothetical protein H7839_08975 [Magnetococcus sp. YQC-5]
MNYTNLVRQDRRRCILQLLEQSPGYVASVPLISNVLDSEGHYVSQEVVVMELTWLERNGMVTLESPGGVVIATLTQQGGDVACGRVMHPGVKRPDPV